MRRIHRRHLPGAACSMLIAAIGCARSSAPTANPSRNSLDAELRLQIAAATQDAPEARQLFADGQPVTAAFAAGSLGYRFSAPLVDGKARLPRFEAMMSGLCGWSRQELRLTEPDAAVIERAKAANKPVLIHASWRPGEGASTTRLFIDNRFGNGVKLGYFIRAPFVREVDVPARTLHRTEIENPACAGSLQFTLDGKPIEPPPPTPSKAASPWAWWLDPTAKRCYLEEKIIYTKFSDSFTQGAILSTHAAGHWHAMSVQDDYILESAPQKITVSDDQIDTLSKTRWSEVDCPQRR